MYNLEKIPVTIVTGFLGAGKTTLIRHLLDENHSRRIAVVINEFGDVGIDRTLLDGCGVTACDNVIELANGCLCCTVADAFLPVMERLVNCTELQPDHIIIETSGLALPKPLVQAFQWPTIRARVMVDGVVVVVDATAIVDGRFSCSDNAVQRTVQAATSTHNDSPLTETFTGQLSCADMVLLNKVDLVESGGLAEIVQALSSHLRAGIRVLPVHYSRVDSTLLLGLATEVGGNVSADECNDHDHDAFESFALTLPAISDLDALEMRLLTAVTSHAILRIKGFLDVPGKAMRLVVQGVGTRIQRYFDRPWQAVEARHSRLVVIGLKGLDRHGIATTLGAS
ncbi:CobW GTPase involved in cobalt insertion for B12 biosynthesis [invertebrate metagenome]|uniref:CobW GTPase involved in cobalt insertion for B12 biosynthesis n=1 Tax=invertebrate metagenome TaxID=1711999 RepID=A0A484H9A2_9ZZZZ